MEISGEKHSEGIRMMFLFKKIIGPLFLPLSLVLEICILGLVLLFFTKKQKAGKIIVMLGVVFLAMVSYGAFSDHLLEPLERQYPPIMTDEQGDVGEHSSGFESTIKWIVVLGGGHKPDPKLPVTSRISDESLVRLAEGIRIHHMMPGSKIVLSGGAVFHGTPETETLIKVAGIFSVNPECLVIDTLSRDTEEQALNIRSIVGKEKFILVTSASHMPRSVAIFKKAGLSPLPAPTGHLVTDNRELTPADFYPSSMGIRKAERAVHEYLGIAWSKLRNKI